MIPSTSHLSLFRRSGPFSRHLQSLISRKQQSSLPQQHHGKNIMELEVKIAYDDSTQRQISKLLRQDLIRPITSEPLRIHDTYYDQVFSHHQDASGNMTTSENTIDVPQKYDFFLARKNIWMRSRVDLGNSVDGKVKYEIKVGPDLHYCRSHQHDDSDTDSDSQQQKHQAQITNVFESSDVELIREILTLSLQYSEMERLGLQDASESEAKSSNYHGTTLPQLLQTQFHPVIEFTTERESYISQCERFQIDLDSCGSYRVGEIEFLGDASGDADANTRELLAFCDAHGFLYQDAAVRDGGKNRGSSATSSDNNNNSSNAIQLKSKIEVLAEEMNPAFYESMRQRIEANKKR